jgi:transcription elongation factor GreA
MEDLKKKLQEEITTLEYELRNELPKEILKARAHGDLRENAEFHAAKERQRYVDSRLSSLKKRLADFSMVDLARIPRDRVGLGSTVLVMDVDKDEEVRYMIVASEESDATKNMVSTSSPIGKGLLGKKVGDEVAITIPGGIRKFEVLELRTMHDLAE